MDDNNTYIIKSGNGYLLSIKDKTSKMTSDYVEASRYTIDCAVGKIKELNKINIGGVLIKLRFGRINA